VEDVRLDQLVGNAVARAKVRAPKVLFRTQLRESVVRGAPAQLDRAVSNLLDNAAKWSSAVDVAVTDSEVTVRDHGPGISKEDLPHVFDRFYRAANARNLPGSGLGLAIVRQVALTHGGDATAENAPDGGAVFRLKLPAST
jgi:two-component system sensor histidine kinase MprB